MRYRRFVIGELATNCYLVWSGNEAGVIDPGGPVEAVVQAIETAGLKPRWIINTHGHADHIGGNERLSRKYSVPILIHPADRPLLSSAAANLSLLMGVAITSPDANGTLADGGLVKLGDESLTVLATPGHTPGGISLYTDGLLFAGDTLFYESIGRTDFPGGDHNRLIASIKEKLLTLPPQTIVLPGHGEETTIGRELEANPFL